MLTTLAYVLSCSLTLSGSPLNFHINYTCHEPLLSLISMASTMLMRDSQRANQAIESIEVLLSVVQDLEFSENRLLNSINTAFALAKQKMFGYTDRSMPEC